MHANKNLVIGVFESLSGMEHALEELRGQGFRNSDISVLAPDAKSGVHHFAGEPLGWVNEAGELGTIGRNNTIVAGGPLYYTLLETGGKNKEDMSGALMSFGVTRFDADFYEICVKAGKSLVAVHAETPECVEKAKGGLLSTGAQSLSVTKSEPEVEEPIRDLPLFAEDLRSML